MLSIVLLPSPQLELLFALSWIKKEDGTPYNVLISESMQEQKDGVLQIIFNNDAPIQEQNVYHYPYQNTIHEYADLICESIRNKIAVHVFGDSHSIMSYKIKICRENWLGFNTPCPLTMFRLGNEGLDLHDCIKIMGNGHEKFPIRPGDIAMYSYGEIDVRYLILKHCNHDDTANESWTGNHLKDYRDIDTITTMLIEKYIKQIKKNEERYGCTSFVYFIVPPALRTEGVNMYTGTLEERKELYQYFTKKLYSACKENNIPVISIYDAIIGEDGLTKEEFLIAPGDIHICHDYYYLVRDKIMEELCGIHH